MVNQQQLKGDGPKSLRDYAVPLVNEIHIEVEDQPSKLIILRSSLPSFT